MKLWQKDKDSKQEVDAFTVGKDRDYDLILAPWDVVGTLAHITMLTSIGLLTQEEFQELKANLQDIYREIKSGKFTIDSGVEDIHSQIEFILTERCGEKGKKIHAARSRNDQVLVDLKLFFRNEIRKIAGLTKHLFDLYQQKSEAHKEDLLPGYTHFQLAMPSSFGLWFGAYAESLVDDIITLQSAWKVANKNPLGSGAGFGSSFPINRTMTTRLLGFEDLNHNVVYAQLTRGKTEKILLESISNIAGTLAKCSADAIVFMNQHFKFISFPDELTTGSSIMPHKKNPDVFELIRAHCNKIQSAASDVSALTRNLGSGYHRDFQLVKEICFPAIFELKDCLKMMYLMIENINVRKNILDDEKFLYLFTVEEMNKLVLQGVPLRDAYRQIGRQVDEKTFHTDRKVHHTHEGSIGNLHTAEISKMMEKEMSVFEFDKTETAIKKLLQ